MDGDGELPMAGASLAMLDVTDGESSAEGSSSRVVSATVLNAGNGSEWEDGTCTSRQPAPFAAEVQGARPEAAQQQYIPADMLGFPGGLSKASCDSRFRGSDLSTAQSDLELCRVAKQEAGAQTVGGGHVTYIAADCCQGDTLCSSASQRDLGPRFGGLEGSASFKSLSQYSQPHFEQAGSKPGVFCCNTVRSLAVGAGKASDPGQAGRSSAHIIGSQGPDSPMDMEFGGGLDHKQGRYGGGAAHVSVEVSQNLAMDLSTARSGSSLDNARNQGMPKTKHSSENDLYSWGSSATQQIVGRGSSSQVTHEQSASTKVNPAGGTLTSDSWALASGESPSRTFQQKDLQHLNYAETDTISLTMFEEPLGNDVCDLLADVPRSQLFDELICVSKAESGLEHCDTSHPGNMYNTGSTKYGVRNMAGGAVREGQRSTAQQGILRHRHLDGETFGMSRSISLPAMLDMGKAAGSQLKFVNQEQLQQWPQSSPRRVGNSPRHQPPSFLPDCFSEKNLALYESSGDLWSYDYDKVSSPAAFHTLSPLHEHTLRASSPTLDELDVRQLLASAAGHSPEPQLLEFGSKPNRVYSRTFNKSKLYSNPLGCASLPDLQALAGHNGGYDAKKMLKRRPSFGGMDMFNNARTNKLQRPSEGSLMSSRSPTPGMQCKVGMAPGRQRDCMSPKKAKAKGLKGSVMGRDGETSARGKPSFSDLVMNGVIKPGEYEFSVGTVQSVQAVVLPTGVICYNNEEYHSISSFALAAARSRNPARQACDGWKEVRWRGQKLETFRHMFMEMQ